MIQVSKIAAAAALLGSVGTANAYAGTPPVVAAKPAADVTATKAEKRYCIVDTTTGTRIPRKTCQTRKQWLERGFDPLAPNG